MTVTLETLRADMEAAYNESRELHEALSVPFNSRLAVNETIRCQEAVIAAQDRAIKATNLFIIARKYGLEKAMLYKLSDGAIDPRGVQ